MSRHKSPEHLQADRDREIRRERRERKRGERDARRKAKLQKRATCESVMQNGIPRVKAGDQCLGLRDAVVYSPLVSCAGCGTAFREDNSTDGVCEKCKHGEVRTEKLGTPTPAGQIEINFEI